MKRSTIVSGFGLILTVFFCQTAMAGARIDLRPTPPVPPGGYQPNSTVRVDAVLVDTGNPQGAIPFRGIFLDFSNSPPWTPGAGTLTFPDPDGPGPLVADYFNWAFDFTICGLRGCPGALPLVSWVFPNGSPLPGFQAILPNDGELALGYTHVHLGSEGGVLDVMNADAADLNLGASVIFGFGVTPNDPVTTWRAFTGELTSGVLELPVIPEPTSCLLLAVALAGVLCRRRIQ